MHNLNQIADKALDALRNAGADTAQCIARFTETHEFNVDGGQFSLFRTLFDNSLSLTAICGGKKGSSSVNRFDDDSILSAAQSCITIANSGESDPAWDFAPEIENKIFSDGSPDAELDLLFDRTKELMDGIAARHPRILMEQMIVTHKKRHSVYKNTKGAAFEATDGDYQIELMFSAHEGEKASSFFGSYVCTDDLSRPFLELGSIEEDLANVEKQLDPVPLSGKFEGTAVFPPSSLSSFLYSILDNFASDTTVLDGTSPWKDKLGEAVADNCITLSAAPRHESVVCGQRFTEDGYENLATSPKNLIIV
jgi:PmbA protein